MTKQYSLPLNDNEKLVNDVRKDIHSRNQIIENIYNNEKLKSSIVSFITKNGGESHSANDVFVFAILTFIKQCFRHQFELRKDINAYIFSVAKYEWMRLSKNNVQIVDEEHRKELSNDINIEQILIDKEKKEKLSIALSQLDQKCKDVLTLWSTSHKMREIAIRMEYKSDGMARKKKHECIKKLRNLFNGKG